MHKTPKTRAASGAQRQRGLRGRAEHASQSGRKAQTSHAGPVRLTGSRGTAHLQEAEKEPRLVSWASRLGPVAACVRRGVLPIAFVAAVGSIAVFASACAEGSSGARPVSYSLSAKQNYEKGLAEAQSDNFFEANKYFSFVKQKFPFSKYAVLAKLALADLHFDRESYQVAIDAYKAFTRLHPTHETVESGYVAHRIAQCYVNEMPEDWLILPPSVEKDQASVKDALRELSDFIDKYPDSEHLEDALKDRQRVIRRLVEHEVYVARFYLDQDRPHAAILRLEGAITRYPASGRAAELLLTLGETHLQMGNNLSAKQTFEKVVEAYVNAPQAKRAQVYLRHIAERFGPTPSDVIPPSDAEDGKDGNDGNDSGSNTESAQAPLMPNNAARKG